jgi:hypothetical protein
VEDSSAEMAEFIIGPREEVPGVRPGTALSMLRERGFPEKHGHWARLWPPRKSPSLSSVR